MRALRRNVVQVGRDVQAAVDLPEVVRRRPVLTLAGSVLAGVFLSRLVDTGSRRMTRRVVGTMIRPLLKPTLAGLGTSIAGLIGGRPIDTRDDR